MRFLQHPRVAAAVLVALVLPATAGCSPRHFPEDFARPAAARSERKFQNLQSVSLNDRSLVGYVETTHVRPKGSVDPVVEFTVYNPKWDRVGLVTESGEVYRSKGADLVLLGRYPLEEGVRLLLRAPSKVQLVQMESGR
ncbi:MAG: hypothetical protein HYY93_08875 [Planctomycetes bacterium]|nr:hypothetical protein [Planctomycetota bacterium]